MIEKMDFVSITGAVGDIDRITNKYLSKYEIHLENALTQLSDVPNLKPYIQTNPYSADKAVTEDLVSRISKGNKAVSEDMGLSDSIDLIFEVNTKVREYEAKRKALMEESEEISESLRQLAHFRQLPYDLSKILAFRHISFRFGKIPKEFYGKFQAYIYDSMDTIFYECQEDERYVWGVYFVSRSMANKVDSIFSLFHFERIYVPDKFKEITPGEAYEELKGKLAAKEEEISSINEAIQELIDKNAGVLVTTNEKLDRLSYNFDVRKKAACKVSGGKNSFILCGWMPHREVKLLMNDIKNDDKVFLFAEKDSVNDASRIPTKLKNPKLFRPYEMYTEMYGLPAYNEIDPTIFIALTYSFIFGAMYGDLGQGLCLLIAGFLLYKIKHIRLAGIIACAGVFSSIFGVLFGSVFGFEDIINAVWLHPKDSMMTLPFIGKLNTVFVYAIGFGMFLILFCMVINVRNAIVSKNKEEEFFSKDALAGIVFYGSLIVVLLLFVTGHAVPAGWVLGLLFGVPLILMFFKEPLTGLLERKKEKLIEGSMGMFLVQGFFELFEVLLSYFSNTLSFVRIGAFAVSHAAMMQVVLMLAGAENGGSPNMAVIVVGNLFVMGLEGLIVGIQVLRLEYYEMFSRFYRGTGRPFKSFFKTSKEEVIKS